jgi:hypothetical protein
MDEKKPPAVRPPSREQFIDDVEAQLKEGRRSLDGLKAELKRSQRLLDEQAKRKG